MCLDKLVAEGLSPSKAAEVLSTITGALVVANALGDTAAYDRATSDLLRQGEAAPTNPRRLEQRGRAPIRRRSS